jgi:alpha-ketoglutarate-dependent 2,4-dichlorophenoxyacetate dioxygenase
MPWTTRRLTEGFGIELSGLQIGPDLSAADRAAVHDTVVHHGVAVVRDQQLSDDALYEFAESLGVVVPMPKDIPDIPSARVQALSNLDADGNLLPPDHAYIRQNIANELWHADQTYMRPRATVSMLYGVVIPPEGGNTEFCDMRLAYEALTPEQQQRFAPLTATHSTLHSRKLTGFTDWSEEALARLGSVDRPLIGVHEATGRKTLALASHISDISGHSAEDSAALMRELTEWATAPERCYAHRWQAGDLLLWDNRCVMHRARPFDLTRHGRDMRSVRLVDTADVAPA